MTRHPARLGALAFALAASIPAWSQGTQTATIAGEVVDSKGTPIGNALVRLSSPALQGERSLRTDGSGRFRAPLLPPGVYRLDVSKEGFNPGIITQRVGLEQTFTPRIILKDVEGAVVEVVSSPVGADKTELKTAQNYTKEQIDALPVSRANLLGIVYLSPGVVENASEARGGVSIRGSMGSGNLFMVDGQNVNDNLYNGQRISIIFDTIDETQVLTGALPAEYGDVEGGVVNSVTKTGGDEFTGAIRWDLSNPSWNSLKPWSSKEAYQNVLSEERSVQFGGPIIKGRLWFHVGYFDTHPREVKSIAGNYFYNSGAGSYYPGAGINYLAPTDDYRREVKLTAALTENHTLSAAFHNYKNTAIQNYGAGDLNALTNLVKTGEFWNVALRSIWTPNLTSNLRFGEKKQGFASTFQGGGNSSDWILWSVDDSFSYRNNLFNPNDPSPDNRNNRTANAKVSYFLDALGNHQFDLGLDWYQGITTASGDQGPVVLTGTGPVVGGKRLNQWWADIYDHDPVAGTAGVYDAYFGEYVPDKLTTTSTALYLNDKWMLNANWIFQLGLRADRFESTSKANGKIGSSVGFSPRLGAKWDIKGDSAWVAGLSFARYNGRMLEATLTNKSYVNNSRYYGFGWTGPARANYAQIQDLANYDLTAPIDFSDPALNIRFDGKLRHQAVDEAQASFTHSFKHDRVGSGYVKVTFVRKEWSQLIDFRAGNDGRVSDPFGNQYYVKTYFNNPDAKRSYSGLELEGNVSKGEWTLNGYVSWSRLRGNFIGEGAASPGRGQGLEYFSIQNGVSMYDSAQLNPEGYLPGHVPLRMRWTLARTHTNGLGKQTLGFLYRFDSGAHYSNTRAIARADINPALSSQFGSTGTQYLGERGSGVYKASAFLDFSIQQDFNLFKIGSRSVDAYLKADISNVLNHQQQVTFDTTWNRVPSGGSFNSPWVASANYGQGNASSYWGEARTIRLSMGVKF